MSPRTRAVWEVLRHRFSTEVSRNCIWVDHECVVYLVAVHSTRVTVTRESNRPSEPVINICGEQAPEKVAEAIALLIR